MAQTANSAEEPSIRLGLLLPPEEAEAASLRQGVQLGVEHANALPGARAQAIIRGRPGQWGDDGTEAARLVLDDGARGLIAPLGGAPSHLTLQVAGRTTVPVVSLCGDSSVTRAGIPWMVRLVPRTVEEAGRIFSGLSHDSAVPTLRWAAFVPDGRAGREATNDLNKAATTNGVNLRMTIEVSAQRRDHAKLIQPVLAAKPEAILLWLDAEPAGQLAKALRTAGFTGILAGPGRLRSASFVNTAGQALEGFMVPSLVVDNGAASVERRFQAAYQQRFNAAPDATAALAYDAAILLIDILRQSGSETPHRAFPLTVARPGASGRLQFDRDGNRIVQLDLLVGRKGRFVLRELNKPKP